MMKRLALVSMLLLAAPVTAQTDADARRRCLEAIRSLQLADGAFRMSGKATEARIVPYFGNLASYALLAGDGTEPQAADVQRVRRWIDWYADHTRPDGTILDHVGRLSKYEPSPKRDSIDTYAPTYLALLRRYSDVRPQEREELLPRAQLALRAIEASIDPIDGLAWASVPHKVKYPMDNLEVCIGLIEGAEFFGAAGAAEDAAKARQLLGRCRAGVASLWLADEGYFAWAKSTRLHISFGTGYPDGVVNLFAAGCIEPMAARLWQNLVRTFGDNPRLSPDMWLIAARRVPDDQLAARYREEVIKATQSDLNLERASRLLLSLAEEQEPVRVKLDLPE